MGIIPATDGMRMPEPLGDQNFHQLPDYFTPFVAKHVLDLRIDLNDTPFPVAGDDGIG